MSGSCTTAFYVDDCCVLQVEELRTVPHRITLVVVGDIDHSTWRLLDSALSRTWEARPRSVHVDLRLATFLSARGLRTLLLANRTARVRGVPLALEASPGLVTRMLVLVGLAGQLVDSDEDAWVATVPHASLPRTLQLVAPLPDDGPAGVDAADAAGSGRRPQLHSLRTGAALLARAAVVAAPPEGAPRG